MDFIVRKNFAPLAGILVFLLIALASEYEFRLESARQAQEQRTDVERAVSQYRASLESELNSTLYLTSGLVAYIGTHPSLNPAQARQILKELYAQSTNIRNIGLAPGNRLTYIYPLEGNEKAIGLYYPDLPEQWPAVQSSIRNHKPRLAGPVQLKQGGIGFIYRVPVFLDDNEEYWGLLSMVIDQEVLFSSTGIAPLTDGLQLALRGKDGEGAQGEVFMGDTALFDPGSVTATIKTPGGSWQLAARPVGGWQTEPRLYWYRAAGWCAGILLGVLLYFALASMARRLRAEDAVKASHDELQEAQRVAKIGNWSLDLRSNKLAWSDEIFRIFEIDQNKFGATYEAFLNAIHPDDREMVNRAYTDSVANRTPYGIVHRLLFADGRIKYVEERCETTYDESGKPLISRGTVQDISGLRQAESRLLEKESQYRVAIETSRDGFCMADAQGRYLEVNEAFIRQSGYSRDELLGMRVGDVDATGSEEITRSRMETLMRTGHIKFESWYRKKNGGLWPVRVVATYSPAGGGRFFAFTTDLTEAKQNEARLRSLFETDAIAVIVINRQSIIEEFNAGSEKIFGHARKEVIGQNVRILMPEPFHSQHDAYVSNYLETGHKKVIGASREVTALRKDGTTFPAELLIDEIHFGDTRNFIAFIKDITERKKIEDMVWQQANFDTLTRLPNRRMFQDRLEQDAKKSHRAGLPMALMLIDLDRFKEVNDTLGHDVGDQLLIEAARRITHCVRESDTVARLGGDEFTVILSELDDLSSVERIAQNIIGKLTEPFRLGAEEVYISASIGISLYPSDSEKLDVLFKNADQAMYVAKAEGRNCFAYFTQDLQEAAHKRLRLTSDLRAALAARQFCVYYQPIVHLGSGEIYKAEALIRWKHPELGMVSPLDFIPLAEETGLIIPIGEWVFKQAVEQVTQWRAAHHPSFQISVNNSPVQIRQDKALSWPDYLKRQGLPGQCITAEITEGVLLNAEDRVNKRLLEFRDAGIQVAIDDFGTGYSSLSYLKEFDIDYLKIDKSFVRNIAADANELALCEAMIVMAHKLGLKVIAEGVETTVQRDLLTAAGCDYAQGYLYSRPVPPEQFEKLLEQK